MAGPYLAHLNAGSDLRTSYTAIRAGFVALALEKNRRATPYVDEARKLQAIAAKAACASDLPKLKEIRLALLTAAGVSDKAAAHLEESDQDEAVAGLIAKYLEPAGEKFVEELVFRFLLTRGDSLGGSMRNVAGALAVRKLTRSIISCLRLSGTAYWWQHSETKAWGVQPDEDADIEIYLRGLSWANPKGKRTLLYNLTVPAVRNNIDLCLLDMDHTKIRELYT